MQTVQDAVVGVFVVLLMLSVGLDLSLSALGGVLRRPLSIGSGLVVGYVVVPAIALGASHAFGLPPAARAGLLLCAVAPGGPMGAFLALQGRGDVALAASLVLLFNVLNTVLVPLGLGLLGADPGELGPDQLFAMARTILLFQVLPLTVGLFVHRAAPAQARRLQKLSSTAANALLIVFAVAMIALQAERFLAVGLRAVLAVVVTVLGALAAGWLFAPRDLPQRTALTTVSAIHSVSLCVLLASTWFPDPATLLTVFAYSAVMFPVGVVAARVLARRAR